MTPEEIAKIHEQALALADHKCHACREKNSFWLYHKVPDIESIDNIVVLCDGCYRIQQVKDVIKTALLADQGITETLLAQDQEQQQDIARALRNKIDTN